MSQSSSEYKQQNRIKFKLHKDKSNQLPHELPHVPQFRNHNPKSSPSVLSLGQQPTHPDLMDTGVRLCRALKVIKNFEVNSEFDREPRRFC